MRFALYAGQEYSPPLWSEIQNVQFDDAGHYAVSLGAFSGDGLPMELFTSGETRWLGIQPLLSSEEEQPRVLLVSVPYALKAGDADTVGGKPASAFVLANAEPTHNEAKTVKGAKTDKEDPTVSAISGSGTPNNLTKWLDSNGTLGDSVITELNGNIGIGAAPTDKLYVNGSVRVANDRVFGFESTLPGINAGRFYATTGNDMVFETNSGANSMLFQTTGGKVGIGTPSAGAKLQINTDDSTGYTSILTGNAAVVPQTFDSLFLSNPNIGASFNSILFGTRTNGSGTGRIGLLQDNTFGGTFAFMTRSSSDANMSERMRITSLGRVGIGTISPSAMLEVAGDINLRVSELPGIPGHLKIDGIPFAHAKGTDNTFLGLNAGNFTVTGVRNTATGSRALHSIGSGQQNTANGTDALFANTTGSYNTAVGEVTLADNTTGTFNTAIGRLALGANTIGSNNTAIGFGAGVVPSALGLANISGSNNTFIGYQAGQGTSTQLTNATAIGNLALVSASNALVLGNSSVSVGIGTQSPTAKLDVNGTVKATSFVGDGSGLTNLAGGPASDVVCSSPCVSTAEIVDGSVTKAKIADGTIENDDINPLAGIAPTKIAGTAAILGANTFIATQVINGALKLHTTSTRPACDATTRGYFWFEEDEPDGVDLSDELYVCKKVHGNYQWDATN